MPPHGQAASDGARRFRAAHVAVAAVAYLVAPYLGLDGFVDPRVSEVWPLGGVGFVLLMTLWELPRRWFATLLVAMTGLTTGTALAFGYAAPEAAWTAVTATAQPLLMAVLLRRWLATPGWRPERQSDIGAYLVATLLSTTLVGLVAGYPRLDLADLDSVVLLWWVLRSSVFCFVGALLFAVLFAPARRSPLPPARWWNTALVVGVAVVCVAGTYLDSTLPLSWLLLLPSVWAGLAFTVRGAAWASLLVALLAAAMTYVPGLRFGYDGPLPAATIVDLLVMASTGFALLLALMREQRAALIEELARRGRESDGRRELLSTVLDTMAEGVLLLGRSGLRAHNAAARQLLGRPLPRDPDVAWTELFHVRDADGRAIDEQTMRGLVRHPSAEPHELQLEVDGRTRVVEVVVTRLVHELDDREDDHPRAVLLRDVTSQRERLRELGDFAGLVAHDLRGPLTVLDGWLELAVEPDAPAEEAEAALVRAREASVRMRQVIEDWLSYTVLQHGQPNPEPVVLAEAAAALVESRRTHAAGTTGPRIHLRLDHVVDADPGLLRQLLDNLVDNAVKYTAADQQPVVRLSSFDDHEPGWVRVEVSDEGIGIPEGQEEAIFEEFHRGPDEGRSRGTGLGLSLTRRIVAMHGGRMSARRNDGAGSTFSFTLPAA